ncbi:unnamed protein product [Onchocerca flexuosa]|uniref:Uncharacterized protein n=1 Tax=Onchocerca flexuosa TaxID=387005 RepID=A0A183HH19_9BILA|nr:unnamed protein product [Onchocerca flexuosa]
MYFITIGCRSHNRVYRTRIEVQIIPTDHAAQLFTTTNVSH